MAKKQDRMTSQERIEALYNRQPVDRVPFVHRGYGFSARNVGYPIADIYEDPQKSIRAQAWTAEMYGSDATPWYTFVSYGAWEFGGEIKWPTDRYGSGPSVARRPVQTEKDVWNLELPDVKTAGCIPRMMEFAQLQEEQGFQIGVICGSPFTHAANLCGAEKFLIWIAMSPETVHKALRLMTNHILEVVQHFVDAFGKGRVLARSAAPTESNALISPKHFEEFAFPYLKELHEKVLAMGVKTIYCHICGEQNKNLPLWSRIPMGDPGMLSFGHEVDIETAAKYFPDHIIAGNVDPQVIARGSPQEVYELSREAIEKGKKCPGGFVLMPGCEIPPTTPPYNMYTMRKAVDEFGWY
jgi:uroporphyrinogen decarboxylase